MFLPAGPLKSAEVERVHGDVIKRIRRVLERYGLDVTVRQAHPGNRGQIVVWS